jgi:hypothetical protein
MSGRELIDSLHLMRAIAVNNSGQDLDLAIAVFMEEHGSHEHPHAVN